MWVQKTNKCILHDSHRAVLYMHRKKELKKMNSNWIFKSLIHLSFVTKVSLEIKKEEDVCFL